jgi:hypothetical protein
MSNFQLIASGGLGSLNIGAALAASAIIPLIAEIDLAITFIGGLKADFVAQFNAAVSFQINFSNPLLTLSAGISAALQVIAGLQAALAIGIPPLSVQISASIAIAAAASLKIGLLNIAIDLALGVVGVGVNFLANLQASLSAGPASIYGWSAISMATLQGQIAGHNFTADGFAPASTVYGVLLMTAAPSAFVGMQFLFLTV